MFIAECKSEKLWKYIDGSAIIPDKDPRDVPPSSANTGEGDLAAVVFDKVVIETWSEKKGTYQLIRDCQAISALKNVPVMEKYEAMLNLNAEILFNLIQELSGSRCSSEQGGTAGLISDLKAVHVGCTNIVVEEKCGCIRPLV
ncbi:hypothetical protein MMC07_006507 [Pseudocyphellaria aurata]|nr:hypothetical protein [Pseudocyphellaria aurata]